MKENNKLKILLVEDDKVTSHAIERTLFKSGYNCLVMDTLSRAVAAVKKETFDLIISDVMLPDGTGLDLLDLVRQFLLDMPFVVITASERKALIKDALNRGASDFLSKPFTLSNLPTVIERNLQRQRLDEQRNGLQRASVLLKAIEALIAALEAKDSYTSGHSRRVAHYARMMGETMNLSQKQLFTLELAAILHDIGKIGMPDSILKKTTSLGEMEYKTAKEHTVIGSKIVGKIDELKEVAAIIRHHHERYDGQGYPDGLRGEVIPLHSRILAIVDAYESIISDRGYNKPLSESKALDEIRRNAASQFDPELVEIFIRSMETEHSTQTLKTKHIGS